MAGQMEPWNHDIAKSRDIETFKEGPVDAHQTRVIGNGFKSRRPGGITENRERL